MEKYFTVYVNGRTAAELCEEMCGNHCYILVACGKGQLEVVLDDLVSISYIDTFEDVNSVVSWLRNNGLTGFHYSVEIETFEGCFATSKQIKEGIL